MSLFRKAIGFIGLATLPGLLLTAPAKAGFITCGNGGALALWNSLQAGDACQIGDKLYTITENTLIGDPTTILNINTPPMFPDIHTLTATGGAFSNTTPATFKYTITTTSTEKIKQFSYTNGSSIPNPDYTWSTVISNGGPIWNQTDAANAPQVIVPINPNQTSLLVEHVYTPNTVAMQQFTDTVTQTPGPLPILGAGMAFGFSRKLRKRIVTSA